MTPLPKSGGEHQTIIMVDIADYDSLAPSELSGPRRALYDLLERSFSEALISFKACYHEDRGDGFIIVIPSSAGRPRSFLERFAPRLAGALERHNRQPSSPRLRLRVAIHAGAIVTDQHGIGGDAVIHVARLLDSAAMKTVRDSTDLALIVSDTVYENLVDPRDRLEYRRVLVVTGESRCTAWMLLFGHSQAKHPEDASRPLGSFPQRLLDLAVKPLPRAQRPRFREEWASMLTELPTRRGRARQLVSLLAGLAHHAHVLRRPRRSSA